MQLRQKFGIKIYDSCCVFWHYSEGGFQVGLAYSYFADGIQRRKVC